MRTRSALLTRRAFVSGLALSHVSRRRRCTDKRLSTDGLRARREILHGSKVIYRPKQGKPHNRKVLQADPEYMKTLVINSRLPQAQKSLPSRFDWRDAGKVTPVRKQGGCGSCWVFAATAAYEAAYLIATNQTSKQLELHVSEQQGLDCSFSETDCALVAGTKSCSFIFSISAKSRAINTPTIPMLRKRQMCVGLRSRPYYLANWAYVSNDPTLASDTAIKQSDSNLRPIGRIGGSHGRLGFLRESRPIGIKTYPNAVFSGTPTKNLQLSNINHEILIVGWD